MIEVIDQGDRAPVKIITRDTYLRDKRNGYCVLVFRPAGLTILRNPYDPTHEIVKESPAMVTYRCMKCCFDVGEGDIPANTAGEAPRTALGVITEHLRSANHVWAYTPFETPYGNVRDVKIEGVEDYQKEITTWPVEQS